MTKLFLPTDRPVLKATTFTRFAMARAVAKNDLPMAAQYASQRWGEDSKVAQLMKAAVAVGSTDSANWAGRLASEYNTAAAEFMGLVRARSILGQMPGIKRLPARTPIVRQLGTAKASWVAEGRPIPVQKMAFNRSTLDTLKLAAMVVISEELARSSDPEAETLFRDLLVNALADASDLAFIDPGNAGVDDEKPASVTNKVTPLTAGGDGSDVALKTDIDRLVAGFSGDLSTSVLIGDPKLFVAMNGPMFPNVGARGGEVAGIPALPSGSAPRSAGDSFTLTLIDAAGVAFVGDDAAADVTISKHGNVEMSDSPTTPNAETVLVSLWQLNLLSVKAVVHENWRIERPGSVAMLSGIAKAA